MVRDGESLERKKNAALAGVLHYLRDEEKTGWDSAPAYSPSGTGSSWALHGRQTTMQFRTLVQRRLLRR